MDLEVTRLCLATNSPDGACLPIAGKKALRKVLALAAILSVSLLCDSALAKLEGEYEKLSGPDACPDGTLQTLVFADEGKRVLLFGSRDSWPMNMKNASNVREIVAGDCSYRWSYKKSKNKFVVTTTRDNCPDHSQNISGTERMSFKDNRLSYEYVVGNRKLTCAYKKTYKPKE